MGGGAAGNRALLHSFQQRGLGLRRSPINFIGENQIRENRARLKAQSLGAMIVTLDDPAAYDVGGHEVGSELNSRILEMQYASERPQQSGLAEARDAFQQHVAASQEADQDPIDHMLLADNDLADFLAHLIEMTGG